MNQLRLLPGQPTTNPFLASLEAGVDLAHPGDSRCSHRAGRLQCVRHPHPEHPDAHVRVAGFEDVRAETDDTHLDHGTAA